MVARSIFSNLAPDARWAEPGGGGPERMMIRNDLVGRTTRDAVVLDALP
jgi:hypothetical protein